MFDVRNTTAQSTPEEKQLLTSSFTAIQTIRPDWTSCDDPLREGIGEDCGHCQRGGPEQSKFISLLPFRMLHDADSSSRSAIGTSNGFPGKPFLLMVMECNRCR